MLVTWVFMILGVLALDFGRYMRDDAVAALNLAAETRNYYIAVGAMNRAFYDLEQDEGAGASTGLGRRRMLALATCTSGSCASDEMEDEEDGREDADDEADGADEDEEGEGLSAADGQWHEDVLNGARYGVRVSDEGGRISLNGAAVERPPVILRLVVRHLLGYGGTAGVDRRGEAAVSTVVDSIVDWVDVDDQEGVSGAESGYYLALEPSFPAKNGFFESMEELLLVRGVTPELFYGSEGMPGLKDVFTPYVNTADHPKVNVLRAPPGVLQALLGIDAEEAAELIDLREEQDSTVFVAQVQSQMQAIDPVVSERTIVGSGGAKVVRVDARADVSVPRNQARVSAIVELSSEITEGVRVIRWFDRAPWEGGLPAKSEDGPA